VFKRMLAAVAVAATVAVAGQASAMDTGFGARNGNAATAADPGGILNTYGAPLRVQTARHTRWRPGRAAVARSPPGAARDESGMIRPDVLSAGRMLRSQEAVPAGDEEGSVGE
jgi:hypothetical protein